MSSTSSACGLCGRPAPPGERFCCRGCAEVHALFEHHGLLDAAATDSHAPSAASGPRRSARYSVRGLWCPSCAWALERYLRRCAGVVAVQVDYLTATCEIDYLGEEFTLPDRIRALGFEAVPADDGGWSGTSALALRAGLALFLGMGVMVLSWSAYAPVLAGRPDFGGNLLQGVAAAGAALVVFVCGWPILRRGGLGLIHRAANMDTLIAGSGLAAFGLSVAEWTRGRLAYFDIPAMLFALLLAGRWLEQTTLLRCQRGLERWQQAPAVAWRWDPAAAAARPTAAAALAPGDEIVLRPAERVPADCRLSAGAVLADESLLTGEPQPLRREPGDTLVAGALITAILGGEMARAVVERPAAASCLAELAAQVERARGARAASRRAQSLDRWAAYFVPAIALLALGTLLANLACGSGGAAAWLRAIAVLVFACPCTLGLAVPLIEERALLLAAQRGIVVQDLDGLLALATCDTLVLDKTGTVTEGSARVVAFAQVAVRAAAAASDNAGSAGNDAIAQTVLRAALALEAGSAHPLGEAVRAFAAGRLAGAGSPPIAPSRLEAVDGEGVRGWLDGAEWRIGRPEFAAPAGLPAEFARLADSARAAAESAVILSRSQRPLALFLLRATEPAGAKAMLGAWSRRRELWLVSGDDAQVTAATARRLGIAHAQGGCAPPRKVELISGLRAQGHRVAMAGDGHNDAPALAAAHVGIAFARGALLACRAAAITLLHPDLAGLDRVLALARQLRRRERAALLWAAIYNVAGLPLAAIGWIGPLAAAIAMVASSFSLLAVALLPFSALRPRRT